MNPSLLSATEALALLRSGSLTAETYADALLERLAASEPVVQAWSYLDPAQVRAAARALTRRGGGGALFGLPIGIKDVFLTADMPTEYNSPLYRGFHPAIDAGAVTLLRAHAALLVGKTHTAELASIGAPPPTTNPHDPARTPGASSSGSAAAVAAFHVPLALGTQTAGSIIRPASFCGVYGMKPSWGLVARDGAKPFAPTLDTIGWFARCAEDLALLYHALVADPRQPAAPVQPHIALCRTPFWHHAEPATVAAFADAGRRLEQAGCRVSELVLPDPFDALIDLQITIMRAEGARSFLPEYVRDPEAMHPRLRNMVEHGACPDLASPYDIAATFRARFDALAAPFEGVLCPSAIGEAPLGLTQTGDYRFNGIWTLLHTPCINLPHWRGPNGMPVGLTLTGPRFTDPALLATAARLQAIFGG
jgi:Asp-tRNA(Asn)/Glu-tRNA(Gln) amidotransferase A subunit family amidase